MTRLRRLAFPASALVVLAAGCQWVLPIHHDEEADRSDAAPPSGDAHALDATGADAAPQPDAAPTPDTGSCNAAYTYNRVCDDCLNQSCCKELGQCFVTNAECLALMDCIMKCGFDFITCPQACADKHEAGVDDFNRANRCIDGYCHPQCSARDAGVE